MTYVGAIFAAHIYGPHLLMIDGSLLKIKMKNMGDEEVDFCNILQSDLFLH